MGHFQWISVYAYVSFSLCLVKISWQISFRSSSFCYSIVPHQLDDTDYLLVIDASTSVHLSSICSSLHSFRHSSIDTCFPCGSWDPFFTTCSLNNTYFRPFLHSLLLGIYSVDKTVLTSIVKTIFSCFSDWTTHTSRRMMLSISSLFICCNWRASIRFKSKIHSTDILSIVFDYRDPYHPVCFLFDIYSSDNIYLHIIRVVHPNISYLSSNAYPSPMLLMNFSIVFLKLFFFWWSFVSKIN